MESKLNKLMEQIKDSIKEIIQWKDLDMENINDASDLIEELDYDGSLHEMIDSYVDIYYYNIRKWAVDNWEYVERAHDEGLVAEGSYDYHKAIQAGQYLYLQELTFEVIAEDFEELTKKEEEVA